MPLHLALYLLITAAIWAHAWMYVYYTYVYIIIALMEKRAKYTHLFRVGAAELLINLSAFGGKFLGVNGEACEVYIYLGWARLNF